MSSSRLFPRPLAASPGSWLALRQAVVAKVIWKQNGALMLQGRAVPDGDGSTVGLGDLTGLKRTSLNDSKILSFQNCIRVAKAQSCSKMTLGVAQS